MTKPVAYEARTWWAGNEIVGYGATCQSALAALDAALFELDTPFPGDLKVRTRPITLGAAYCDRRRLQGLSVKDEIRARD